MDFWKDWSAEAWGATAAWIAVLGAWAAAGWSWRGKKRADDAAERAVQALERIAAGPDVDFRIEQRSKWLYTLRNTGNVTVTNVRAELTLRQKELIVRDLPDRVTLAPGQGHNFYWSSQLQSTLALRLSEIDGLFHVAFPSASSQPSSPRTALKPGKRGR